MTSTRLRQIAFLFPTETSEQSDGFATFADLLAQAPGATRRLDGVLVVPTYPESALPVTMIQDAGAGSPEIVLETDQPIELNLGALRLRSSAVRDHQPSAQPDAQPTTGLVSAAEVARRLDGHLTRVDHTGVNLPTRFLDRARWEQLRRQLGAVANVYRYPTGGEWPFVVPATKDEFRDDIREFAPGRGPKFELVYDPDATQPILQFALGTDLTRPEAESLFPDPEGVALPGIGEYFRSIFLASPWPGLAIRVDLYYHGGGPVSDWETGEWLVTTGGRIR